CFQANSQFSHENGSNVRKCDLHHNDLIHRGKFDATRTMARHAFGVILLALMPFCANAQSGRITFSGRLVMPTCAAPAESVSRSFVAETASVQHCGSASGSSTRPYHLYVAPVSAHTDDQVLNYFFHYVTSTPGQHQAPALMTLQYD